MSLKGHEGDPQFRQGENPQNLIGTEFDFGGIKERVITRDDFSLEQARDVLKDETIAVIGYGVQGPAQANNLRDNGLRVIVGQRGGPGDKTYDKAVDDGWVPGKTLFSIEEATRRASNPEKPLKSGQVQNLLSDAGQVQQWNNMRKELIEGSNLYFSHGFGYTFRDITGIFVPEGVDVTLIAPKGAGRSVREHFLAGRGINSSYAVGQDATGRAIKRSLATGMGIGSGFLFKTTFEQEVFSDLTGERGVLMGAAYGLWQAAYNVLREDGFSPEQAAQHTVESSTQVISKIIGERGADGLVRDLPRNLKQPFVKGFIASYQAVEPVFDDLYKQVATGSEAKRVLDANSKPDYRETLDRELKEIADSELGMAATGVRNQRGIEVAGMPPVIDNHFDAVMAGALVGLMHSQYDLFRNKSHMPSEAFNETVEEATQSLYPLIDRNGIDWMYANCSTTAQRGALDWNGKFRDAIAGRIGDAYRGREPASTSVIEERILGSEMWKAGETVRNLRPENQRL